MSCLLAWHRAASLHVACTRLFTSRCALNGRVIFLQSPLPTRPATTVIRYKNMEVKMEARKGYIGSVRCCSSPGEAVAGRDKLGRGNAQDGESRGRGVSDMTGQTSHTGVYQVRVAKVKVHHVPGVFLRACKSRSRGGRTALRGTFRREEAHVTKYAAPTTWRGI